MRILYCIEHETSQNRNVFDVHLNLLVLFILSYKTTTCVEHHHCCIKLHALLSVPENVLFCTEFEYVYHWLGWVYYLSVVFNGVLAASIPKGSTGLAPMATS